MIISCQLEDLPLETDSKFRHWLGMSECGTLRKVAEAQAKKFAVAALVDASEASEQNHMLDGANANLRMAQKWTNFLDLLNTLIQQKEPFKTAKLS